MNESISEISVAERRAAMSYDVLPPKNHNNPPKTPFEIAVEQVDTLHVEAGNWLDGDAVENQAQADMVSKLLDDARKARKVADDARKIEAAPFDDGKSEVQARYRPLLAKADIIADLCKKVLAPFLAKIEAEKREVERIAREKAEAAAEAARKACQEADATNLAARENAENLILKAKYLEAAANRAAKDKGAAKGGARAVTLRSVWTPEIHDLTAAARHYWTTDRAALEALVMDLVQRDVRAGARVIPGVTITEERVAQ